MSTTPKTTVKTSESKPIFGGKSTFNSTATRGSDRSSGSADTKQGAESAAVSGLPNGDKDKSEKK